MQTLAYIFAAFCIAAMVICALARHTTCQMDDDESDNRENDSPLR